jgi:hypothetical protein
MGTERRSKTKEALHQHIALVYGAPGEFITKERFLHQTWEALSSLIRHNKHLPLVSATVRDYPYFIAWSYVLMTILHGSYSCEVKLTTFLKDAIDLLGEDLVEKEIELCNYARSAISPFFPGLFDLWQDIQSVHQSEYFDARVLPPTAYHSYVLYVLNNTAAIGRRTSPEEIYGTLSIMHAKMTRITSVVHSR